MEFWELRVRILHSKQGPNPAGGVGSTLEINAVELTIPRKRKASSPILYNTEDHVESPYTQGNHSHDQNEDDEQQMPPSLQKGCGSAPGNLSWDLTAMEESRGESQSKFTQALWPKISERRCEVSPRTSMLVNGSCISLSCWPELQAPSSGALGASLFL